MQSKEYTAATLIIGILDSWITQPLKICNNSLILLILKDV